MKPQNRQLITIALVAMWIKYATRGEGSGIFEYLRAAIVGVGVYIILSWIWDKLFTKTQKS